MFDIGQQLKSLPEKPGVYLMKDKEDHIIYVGKAKVLKNRVRQYFQTSKNHSLKVQTLVSNIHKFEYIVTDSELEALVLECNLIKKYKPRYNVLLKDDKHYPYIKVTMNESYPRIFVTRKIEKDGARYFGPYTSSFIVKETIDAVTKIFSIRSCSRVLPKDIGKQRPCLNHHIKQCLAPCTGQITQQTYKRIFKDICSFLGGKQQEVIEKLTRDMYEASEKMDFERAADLRDKIQSIQKVSEKQKIISATLTDQDIIGFAQNEEGACVQIFFIRSGKLIGREHFMIDNVAGLEAKEMIATFVKQFYNRALYIPKEIVIQKQVEEEKIIQQWLSDKKGTKAYIKVPQKGEKYKLMQMVEKNARETLQQQQVQIKQKELFTQNALQELKTCLGLDVRPIRIEAYDISNTGGFDSVGAMVVFEDGQAVNQQYRKFRIKSIEGPNDYESIKEVLFRRFKRAQTERQEIGNGNIKTIQAKFINMPQLILIDGGKGHVSVAKSIMKELGINIAVFGMVKNERHKTRALTCEKNEYALDANSSVFRLVAKIQEEVHRVAISYHRGLREKRNISSELENIKGIGQTRRKNLLIHFKTIDNIKNANTEEIAQVKGMNEALARQVHGYFQGKKK